MPWTVLGAAVALLLLPSMVPFAADASRQVPPPHFPLNVAPPTQLTLAPSSSVALGQFTVVFGETSLGAVLKQVKVGRVDRAGDASESVYWLCYSIRTAKTQERMWMLSHGEMDGLSHVIYGVVARSLPRTSVHSGCPDLPRAFHPVRLDNGVWLRSRASEIRGRFGKPSVDQNGWLHYSSRRELPNDPRAKDWGAEKLFELGEFSARLRDQMVVELWATKSLSD